ncbi:MAG: hypothetical protein Q9225_001187, partial [Loekoesia sp. 1 TL-2023]
GERGRKRKRRGVKREELTYAERQQRRIERKFGRNGQVLGGEEEARVKLESGKKPKGKPRVAGSARGRELRAAAALARFGAQKEEEVKKEEAMDASESESESESEDVKPEKEALDLNGSKLLDSQGRGMVKVCEDEEQDDIHVKQEMDELHDLAAIESHKEETPRRHKERLNSRHQVRYHDEHPGMDDREAASKAAPISIKRETTPPAPVPPSGSVAPRAAPQPIELRKPPIASACPVCSMANEPSALVCIACSHVLQPQLMPGNWQCQSSTCKGSKYINAGDCGICGACGAKRPGP